MKQASSFHAMAILVALPLAINMWQEPSCRSGGPANSATRSMNTNTITAPGSQDRELRGIWGGQHIAMEVTDDGAQIEFDCAHGRITEKIAPDRDGKFDVKGVFARQRGGPERIGKNNDQPARYQGSIKEKTMTLTIELTRDKEDLGKFTLTKGSNGRLTRCL
jgi:hypothetical protein